MVERVGLGKEMTAKKADRWAMEDIGVGDRWMGEIMEGSTRTNVRSQSLPRSKATSVERRPNGPQVGIPCRSRRDTPRAKANGLPDGEML